MHASLPKISIITPSFNQGRYIEATIRSVIDQAYPALEYFVMDGGSTDQSSEILRHYADRLTAWESGPDRGQSHAINKGLLLASGEVIGWLNSDDQLVPDALWRVGEYFQRHPECDVLVGDMVQIEPDGSKHLRKGRFVSRLRLLSRHGHYQIQQPSVFWRRRVQDRIGLLDESAHLIMDYDYWCRMSKFARFDNLDQVLALSQRHPEAKTADNWETYHAARRAYVRELRLSAVTRLRLWLLETWLGAYDLLRATERSLRLRLRHRSKSPGL